MHNNHPRSQKKKGKRKGPGRGRGGRVAVSVRQPVPRFAKMSRIIPTELDVWMNFHDQILLVGNGLGGIAKQFNPNCPFDVDPSLGSTSTPGFAEMAGLFGFVRVIKYKYKVQFLNKEAINISCFVVNGNSNPGTGNLLPLVGNDYTKCTSIGPMLSGKGIGFLSGTINVAQLVGSMAVETDDSYASTTAAVPTNKVWLSVGNDYLGGTGTTAGSAVVIDINMLCRFYERKVQTS